MFTLGIPYFAQEEELRYRKNTRNWAHALPRSIRFGLAHCMMGVPLYVALAISLGGLWFSWHYFQGGTQRSTLAHATYNLIIVVLMLILLLLR